MRTASILLVLLVTSTMTSLITPVSMEYSDEGFEEKWTRIELDPDVMKNLVGYLDETLTGEQRLPIAESRLGVHDVDGLLIKEDIPSEFLLPRDDLSLLIISNEITFLNLI